MEGKSGKKEEKAFLARPSGLITRRSLVQIQSPLPKRKQGVGLDGPTPCSWPWKWLPTINPTFPANFWPADTQGSWSEGNQTGCAVLNGCLFGVCGLARRALGILIGWLLNRSQKSLQKPLYLFDRVGEVF